MRGMFFQAGERSKQEDPTQWCIVERADVRTLIYSYGLLVPIEPEEDRRRERKMWHALSGYFPLNTLHGAMQ